MKYIDVEFPPIDGGMPDFRQCKYESINVPGFTHINEIPVADRVPSKQYNRTHYIVYNGERIANINMTYYTERYIGRMLTYLHAKLNIIDENTYQHNTSLKFSRVKAHAFLKANLDANNQFASSYSKMAVLKIMKGVTTKEIPTDSISQPNNQIINLPSVAIDWCGVQYSITYTTFPEEKRPYEVYMNSLFGNLEIVFNPKINLPPPDITKLDIIPDRKLTGIHTGVISNLKIAKSPIRFRIKAAGTSQPLTSFTNLKHGNYDCYYTCPKIDGGAEFVSEYTRINIPYKPLYSEIIYLKIVALFRKYLGG